MLSMNEFLRFREDTMVVKIGSKTMTEGGNPLNGDFMVDIARQVSTLREGVRKPFIVIVSSGATACGEAMLKATPGRGYMGNAWDQLKGFGYDDDSRIRILQMAAAFGQPQLMKEWSAALGKYGQLAAQLLLTDDHLRGENAKNIQLVLELTSMWGVPVVNANDPVNSAEMRKLAISADNDQLACYVAQMIRAGTTVFLTDKDGVLNDEGHLVEYVEKEEDVQAFLRDEGDGTGSMASKAKAAASLSGFPCIHSYSRALIANGRRESVLLDAAVMKHGIGTWFAHKRDWLESY